MPQISVIVPVYKVEQYLPACVDSILAQTFTDFELILVDDGSPDGCGAMCDAYAEKDPRIKVIHQKNGGLSAARNAGMDVAVGANMSFIDSDDYVAPDYLELLFRNAERSGAEIAVCRTRIFPDGQDPAAVLSAEEPTCTPLTGREAAILLYQGDGAVPVNAWGKLYRTELIADLRFPVGKLHEDQAFVPIACYRADTVACLQAGLYFYRDRPNSITTGTFSLKRYDDIWAIDQCLSFFKEKGESRIVAAAQEKRQRVLCSYSILAKADCVDLPEEYDIPQGKALRYLKKHVSENKYMYFLSKVHPKLVRPYSYCMKLRSVLHRNAKKE